MPTRRAFLADAAATLALSPGRARAVADAPPTTLMLEPVTLALPGFATPIDRLRVGGLDGALSLSPEHPHPVALKNGTPEPVSFEWIGLRGRFPLDAAGEGLRSVAPNASRDLAVLPRDPGTTLIRATPAPNNAAGRGALLPAITLEPGAPVADQDHIVVVQDLLCTSSGTPCFGSTAPRDAVRRVMFVNGLAAPLMVAARPRARVRLRLVNASVQCVMLVACTGAKPMIVAIDGQPSTLFAPVRDSVPLGPGTRTDVLLDMPDASGATVEITAVAAGAPRALQGGSVVARLTVEGAPLPKRGPIAALPANPALPVRIPLEAAKRVDLTIAGTPATPEAPPRAWSLNGITGATGVAPFLTVLQGDAVTLGFINGTAMTVPIRVGGQTVRILHALDDGWQPYWRDTLLLPPNSRTHVAFVADVPGRWPITSGYDDLTLAGLSGLLAVTPR